MTKTTAAKRQTATAIAETIARVTIPDTIRRVQESCVFTERETASRIRTLNSVRVDMTRDGVRVTSHTARPGLLTALLDGATSDLAGSPFDIWPAGEIVEQVRGVELLTW